MNGPVVPRPTVARERRRGGSRVPLRPPRRPSGRAGIVAPDEMPEECPEDDGPEGNEEAENLVDPIHGRQGKERGTKGRERAPIVTRGKSLHYALMFTDSRHNGFGNSQPKTVKMTCLMIPL